MAKRSKVTIYSFGDERRPGEGLRIGVTRYPPRGVVRADWSRRNFFDVWYPNLAPSAALIRWLRAQDTGNPAVWRRFFRAYEREMRQPAARANIALLAALARETPLAIGCYCEDESRCHRRASSASSTAAGKVAPASAAAAARVAVGTVRRTSYAVRRTRNALTRVNFV